MDPGASKAVCNPNHSQSHTRTYTLLTSPPAQNHPLGPPRAENQTQVSVCSLPPRPPGSAGPASSPVFTCWSSLQPRSGELHSRPLAHPFLPLLPWTAPCTQVPPGGLLFQGPERGPVLWGLSTASPRLLPKTAPQEPPNTSVRSTLLGWGS